MNRQQQLMLTMLFCFASISILHAQEKDSLIRRPGQITFITPLGTNGRSSGQTINNFSLNLLLGTSAGVKGAEVGGLINISHGKVSGLQVSGLANLNSGCVNGLQVGGLSNIGATGFRGVQIAGLTNMTKPSLNTSKGMQIAGLLNKNSDSTNGFQAAGLFNQQAGAIQGVQIAGLVNDAEGKTQGAQVAGILNKTKTLSGVQIGLINIADSVQSGVQIGLINIAKNGYRIAEVEYNESFYVGLNYKMGTRGLYTILSVAYAERDGKQFWAPGFGLGTYCPIGTKAGLSIDAIHYQVNEDKWWTDETNMLDKLKITGSWPVAAKVSVYAGASLNVQISKIKNADGKPDGSMLKTPKALYDEIHHNTHILIYPGFSAGLRF